MALALVVSPAIAVPKDSHPIGLRHATLMTDHKHFDTTLSYDEAENVDGRQVDVTIKFDKVTSLAEVQAATVTVTIVNDDFSSTTYAVTSNLGADDPNTLADDEIVGFGPVIQKDIDPSTAGPQHDGQTFTFTIPATQLLRAGFNADGAVDAAQTVSASKIYVSIPAGIPSLDPGDADTSNHQTLAIDLRTVTPQDRDTPRVVSIQRLRPGSQTVVDAFQEAAVTGPFTVRIVLSETPHEPTKFHEKIKVDNGEKSGYVIGTPFARHGGMNSDDPPGPEPGETIRPHPIEGRYNHDGVYTATLGDPSTLEDNEYPPLAGVPEGLDEEHVPLPTGPTGLYWECRIDISPHRRASTVTIKIDEFHDGDAPRNYYYPHQVDKKPNGREQLHLPVDLAQFNLQDGRRVNLPHNQKAKITYANSTAGHYILATNKAGSHIKYYYHEDTDTPPRENKPLEQTPAELLYNVRQSTALPNLETFLSNNGTIHLVSYDPKHNAGDAYISEVMWGTDASQNPVRNSNWIEIRNGTSGAIAIGDRIWALWFYEAHETPPTAYPADSYYEGPIGQAGTIIDVIGTKASDTGLSWSIAGKGQSGRTNIDVARTEEHVLTPTTPLISMYRKMVPDTSATAAAGAMVPGDGTLASSWVQTDPPSVNVGGPEVATNLGFRRENAIVATPGAAPFATPDTIAAEETAAEETAAAEEAAAAAEQERIRTTGTYPIRGDGRVYISEIMFAGGGTLPQWIEISNGDRAKEFNLSGWTLTIDNALADADVSVGSRATFTIPDGTKIAASGQNNTPSTILVVTEEGRNSFNGAKASGQIINLDEDNQVELILAGVVRGKYTLLSSDAFLITLAPPQPAATTPPAGETVAARTTRLAAERTASTTRKAATDTVGNLGADGAAAWALPTNEAGGRSSIIRNHIEVVRGPAAPEDGMMAENWVLASDTAFADVTHIRAQSYYGAANDVGTPGFRAGGALPVELSHFRPARDEAGAVVITWSTQSELNNAGFFIKRSQQRDGEFKVINAAMVPGAGTTSEKQSYTYTDTTANPNIVYYYQIEDVSFDGQRQTLTRGIRLKGHIGAAGKATTTWGELKHFE